MLALLLAPVGVMEEESSIALLSALSESAKVRLNNLKLGDTNLA